MNEIPPINITTVLKYYAISLLFIILVSCVSAPNLPTSYQQLATDFPTQILIPTKLFVVDITTTPALEASKPPSSTPAIPTYTPTPDTRLTAKYWRKWNEVPELSYKAEEILRSALAESNLAPNTFSKVGDCQFTTGTFLAGYVNGVYLIPSGMEPTVLFFRDSMLQDSITAAGGLGISSVLNPMFGLAAGHTECTSNETPLNCELRVRRPAFVLIAMGTNWAPHAEISYEKYLRQVVDTILETGALPILSTKADNVEEDWKLNEVTAQVAYDYDLPLVNVWRAVQFLPNHGLDLESPKKIYLTPNGWLVRNDVWLRMLDLIRHTIEQELN